MITEDITLEKIVGEGTQHSTLKNIDLAPELHKVDLSNTGVIDRNLGQYMDFYALAYNTPTKTHKGEKAKTSLEWCVNNEIDFALFGNFSKELNTSSEGSGMDALDYFSQFYPVDVVGFVPLNENEKEPYIVIETSGDGRNKIRIHLNTKDYLSPNRLEQIFRCCLNGKAETQDDPLEKMYKSKMAKEVAKIARSKKENPGYRAITNIYEFDPDTKAYFYEGKLKKELDKKDIVIRTIGSGESFLGQIKSLKPTYNEKRERTGPIHIGVTTYGNCLAGWLMAVGSKGNNRLNTLYPNPAHEEIKKYMQDPRYDIRLLFLDDIDETSSGGVATKLKSNSIGDLIVSETGSYGLAPLLKKNCMTKDQYLKDLGIEGMFPGYSPFDGVIIFPGLKKYEDGELKDSKLVLPKIKRKYRVCFAYTGCSQKAA